ncbi:RimK family alpha-L-glutamate ligase [Paenibacillus sp. NPDC058177]|uniref:ATP-grasp domain-containing protein n=1 Tax=Paenibacillus sp. NPDC058177 TaxID=3346369 RepID=UPI0036DC0F89
MSDILVICRSYTHHVKALEKSLSRNNMQVTIATPKEINVEINTEGVSYYINGIIFFPSIVIGWLSLEKTREAKSIREWGLWLLKTMELEGIKVINTFETFNVGQNKLLNSIMLTKHCIPHIPTELVSDMQFLQKTIEVLNLPVVVKPVIGSKSHDVQRVDDLKELEQICNSYFSKNLPVYIQKYIEKPGRDIRVTVINHKAISAQYRSVDHSGFLTKKNNGALITKCHINEELGKLSEKCSKVFNAPFAGIDLLEDEEGTYRVIEVNIAPALLDPDEDILNAIVVYLKEELISLRKE